MSLQEEEGTHSVTKERRPREGEKKSRLMLPGDKGRGSHQELEETTQDPPPASAEGVRAVDLFAAYGHPPSAARGESAHLWHSVRRPGETTHVCGHLFVIGVDSQISLSSHVTYTPSSPWCI